MPMPPSTAQLSRTPNRPGIARSRSHRLARIGAPPRGPTAAFGATLTPERRGNGPLTQPTPAAQLWGREPLFMPTKLPVQAAPRVARASGGEQKPRPAAPCGPLRLMNSLYLRARTTCTSCGDVSPSSVTAGNAALISRTMFLSKASRCALAIRSTKPANGVADN